MATSEPASGRTLAIGLDGCSWNVLEPLLQTGQLPHLAQLRDTGAHGTLESTIPYYTGPAWASYATGTTPAAHGIYDFMLLRPDGTLTVAKQTDLQRPTYYHQLGREHRRTILVNLPLDQDGCPGATIVNSWLTVDERRRIFPAEARGRHPEALAGYRSYPTTFHDALATHVEDLSALERSRFELARELLEREEWDHFFVLFSSTDWLAHACAGGFLAGEAEAREAYLRLYRELDGYVGALVAAAPDATVALLSDHGQCAETHVVRPNALLRELGYVRLRREAAAPRTVALPVGLARLARSRSLVRLARACRSLLRRAGARVVMPREGLDVDRVASRAFVPTVASYAVHARDVPGGELDEIAGRLRALRLDDGRPAFDGVWRFEELYGRERRPGDPALLYAPALGVRPSVACAGPLTERLARSDRGAHQRDGILVLAGEGVRACELGRVSLYDVAPTLLWAMGSAVPGGCEGRVLAEAFDGAFAAAHELRETTAEADEAELDAAVEDDGEVLRRLGALGYL